MLRFCWLFLFLAAVKGQGGPPGPPADAGGGGPPEQDCVLLITSSMYLANDDFSKDFLDPSSLSTERYNETFSFITGEVETKRTIDTNTLLNIQVLKLANGKESTAFSVELKVCDEMALEGDSDFFALLQYLGIPKQCPIEPGKYPVNNLVADMKGLPINSGNIGNYMARLDFVECQDAECTDKKIMCTVLLDCIIEMV